MYHPSPSFRYRYCCHTFLARACFFIKPMCQQCIFASLSLAQLLIIPAVLSLFFVPLRNEKKKYIYIYCPECDKWFRIYFWTADSKVHRNPPIERTPENMQLLLRSNIMLSQQFKTPIFIIKAKLSLLFLTFDLYLISAWSYPLQPKNHSSKYA